MSGPAHLKMHTSATPIRTRHSPWVQLAAAATSLCAIALLGMVQLPTALHGDQALYQLGAQRIAGGAKLYVDFWDGKSPGIYLFHLLAGSTFGWGENGLHALELIWQLVLAVYIMKSLRPWLRSRWLGPFAAFVVVGGYYAKVDEWHLTQPAALLMLPIFLVEYFALRSRIERGRQAYLLFAAGLFGSVGMIFKEECVVLVVSILAVSTIPGGRANRPWKSKWLKRLGYGLLGLATGVALFSAWCWSQGFLRNMLWTLFVFPVQAMSYHHFRPVGRLISSLDWFGRTFWLLCIATLGVTVMKPFRAQQRVAAVNAVWLVAGLATIVIEPFAWWPFDTMLLLPPVGILATIALDRAFARIPGQRWQRTLAGALLASALVLSGLRASQRKARAASPWLRRIESSESFRMRESSLHRSASGSSRFLTETTAATGPIYVVGDPNLARLGGRTQIGRINGWGWEILLPSQLKEAAQSIQSNRPPYIYIESGVGSSLAKDLPAFAEWLKMEYPHQRVETFGMWLSRQEIPALPAR